MNLADLTPEEDAVLLGWVREIVSSDGYTSAAEHVQLSKLRDLFGRRRYDVAVDAAHRRFPTRESLREAARHVTRPAARRAIHRFLETLAASDAIIPAEDRPLRWLAASWDLD